MILLSFVALTRPRPLLKTFLLLRTTVIFPLFIILLCCQCRCVVSLGLNLELIFTFTMTNHHHPPDCCWLGWYDTLVAGLRQTLKQILLSLVPYITSLSTLHLRLRLYWLGPIWLSCYSLHYRALTDLPIHILSAKSTGMGQSHRIPLTLHTPLEIQVLFTQLSSNQSLQVLLY